MAKRETPEVNAGSMADIAFLLLIFFLVTTTMDVDRGMTRRLPEILPKDSQIPPINERNLFIVLINSSNQLLVENQPMDVRNLREKTKEFITNPSNNKDLSDKVEKDIAGLGKVMVSKGVISLQNDRGTSYEMYMKVQNELVAAYSELRDQYASQKFGKSFKDLEKDDPDKAQIVKDFYPQRISEAEPKTYGKK